MKKSIIFIISIFFIFINQVSAKETVKFYKCVDGDTFKIKLKDEVAFVRMLAIDTPESVKPESVVEYYGKEASEYTCNKLKNAKSIKLEYDDKSDKYDKYDRLLAWVFIDNKLLQEELVENGYAKVAYLYDDYKYIKLLQEKQELASAKKIGIWNTAEANKFNPSITPNAEANLDNIENKEVFIIVILFLIFVSVSKLFRK